MATLSSVLMSMKLPRPHASPTSGFEPTFKSDEDRWNAVVSRDVNAGGAFFFAVRTTGVYCRPSCPARLPKRENVAFFTSTCAARAAGFRPCKRCQPDDPPLRESHRATVERICREFECLTEFPRLETLGASAGLSTFHFHRLFKSITGVTPRAYFATVRNRRLQQELGRAKSVTEAIYESGFNSSGRFYAATNESLGMTPQSFRRGGSGVVIEYAVTDCSLGSILVAATGRGVSSILLGDDAERLIEDLQRRFPNANIQPGDARFEKWMAAVVSFVERPIGELDLPLDIQGTAFQRRVWDALRRIPAGSTLSYSEVANNIGSPKSSRAVAQACASNPLAVAIPCHRVVRNDGALSGYRWGVERKRSLLAREKVASTTA